ncbi:MAG: DUF4129 domain-containing protein [Chloroflexota bacterium]
MRAFARRTLILLGLVLMLASRTSSALADSIGPDQAQVPAGSDALSESEYWDLVEESYDVVSGLTDSADDMVIPELAALAGRWQTVESVRLDDGNMISLDNSYLLAILATEEPNVEHIASVFEALLAAHENYPSGVFTIQDLDSLHEILARPEFQWKEESPNPFKEWFARIISRLLQWLGKFLGWSGEVGVTASPVIQTLIVIALVLVLFFVFRSLIVDFITEARLAEDTIAEEMLTSESAFQKAQALSRGGDYRSAVRFLYLSSLLLLDERGVLRYDRSKTNREYLRGVSNSPELQKPLSEVIEVFDQVWYGYHSLDEDAFKHYSERVEELKEKKE